MDHLFDADNDERNRDQEGQENGFQQQIHQLLRLVADTFAGKQDDWEKPP
ncbi:2565_t:CDS:2 [Gigaspora rosea]|nr:2565_t:CDS:2 [Gigaspora rosea]